MRLLLLIALVLGFAPTAAAANQPHPTLDAVASEVAEKPVSAWCEMDLAAWTNMAASAGLPAWAGGYTYPSTPTVYIAPQHCSTLRVALNNGVETAGAYWFSGALLTLAHESVHQRGILDEQLADCTALALVGTLATKHFGVTPTVTIKEPRSVSRTVVRRVRGVVVRLKVRDVVMVSATRPNPLLAQIGGWAAGWHSLSGPPC